MATKPKDIEPGRAREILARLLRDVDAGKLVIEVAQKISHGQGEYTYVIGVKAAPQETKGSRAS